MIKLLRGDDAKHLISLELPEVAFSEGMTVIFEIGGLKVTAPAAPSIEVQFPSTWTALQPCGRILGSWKIRDRNGNIGTLTKTFPVYLTDDVGEITSGSIVSGNVKPVVDFSDIAELTTSATPGDVKAALNEILRRLKTGLSCLLITLAIPAFSAELTPDTIMNEVPGTTTLSNLVSAAGVTVGGGTDGNAVTNIVKGIVKVKRDYTDLSYNSAAYWEITDGTNTAKLLWNEEIGRYEGVFDKLKYSVKTYKESISGTPVPQYKYYLYISKEPTFPGAMGIVDETFNSREEFTSFTFVDVTGTLKQDAPDALALRSEIPTEAKLKEVAGAALGRTYDAELGITWRKEARGGAFFEVCETNINTAVVK